MESVWTKKKNEQRLSQINSMQSHRYKSWVHSSTVHSATPPTNLTKHFCELTYASEYKKKTKRRGVNQQASSIWGLRANCFNDIRVLYILPLHYFVFFAARSLLPSYFYVLLCVSNSAYMQCSCAHAKNNKKIKTKRKEVYDHYSLVLPPHSVHCTHLEYLLSDVRSFSSSVIWSRYMVHIHNSPLIQKKNG